MRQKSTKEEAYNIPEVAGAHPKSYLHRILIGGEVPAEQGQCSSVSASLEEAKQHVQETNQGCGVDSKGRCEGDHQQGRSHQHRLDEAFMDEPLEGEEDLENIEEP